MQNMQVGRASRGSAPCGLEAAGHPGRSLTAGTHPLCASGLHQPRRLAEVGCAVAPYADRFL